MTLHDAQLGARLIEDGPGPLQREDRHGRGHDQVRPAGTSAKHAKGGKQYRKIAEYVVARANPCRAHVGIARR
jgi:hypothetical protein